MTELFENRDYPGSTHFFFDIGHDNALAFFDFPGLEVGSYEEVLGGLHHLAISVEPDKWARLKSRLDDLGIEYAHIHGSSIYFRGPDGERLELACPTVKSRVSLFKSSQWTHRPPGSSASLRATVPANMRPTQRRGNMGQRDCRRLPRVDLPRGPIHVRQLGQH